MLCVTSSLVIYVITWVVTSPWNIVVWLALIFPMFEDMKLLGSPQIGAHKEKRGACLCSHVEVTSFTMKIEIDLKIICKCESESKYKIKIKIKVNLK